MSFEILMEFILGNQMASSGIFILLKPFCSLVFELEGSELDKVLRPDVTALEMLARSEERRVGKECRSRWSPYH